MTEEFLKTYSRWMSCLDVSDKDYNKKLCVAIRASSILFKVREEWSAVKGFNDWYEVSNFGRLKSKARTVSRNGAIPIVLKEKILMCHPHKGGYLKVALSANSFVKRFYAHRLVMESFIANPLLKTQVNHKDSVRNNNFIGNLEWCTPSENAIHGYKEGNRTLMGGESSCHAKPIIQISINGSFIKEWATAKEASLALGISDSGISVCRKNQQKTRGGYKWVDAVEYYR